MDRLRIAILGTRGIPGNYGGFETFAEELSIRLSEAGHSITVYCRSRYNTQRLRTYRGVRLVTLPALPSKHAETLSHTLLCVLHAALRRYDIVYVCNSANAVFCYIPWLRRQRVVLNVDGLEWQRAKWGRLARTYYRLSARLAARMPIDVVTDARVIQEFYRTRLKRETVVFPYGTTMYERGHGAERLGEMGLRAEQYLLYVSRLEPENNALLVVRAYRRIRTELPLVIVGDAPYAKEYIDLVQRSADRRVRFLGYRFGEDYHALQANARFYVQATEVGGTHPALVEALGHRNAVLAHDVPEHREVVGDAARFFRYRDEGDLATQMRFLIDHPEDIEVLRQRAAARVATHYGWGAIAREYESYFRGLKVR